MNKVLHSFIHEQEGKVLPPPPFLLDVALKYKQSSVSANVDPPLTLTQLRHQHPFHCADFNFYAILYCIGFLFETQGRRPSDIEHAGN